MCGSYTTHTPAVRAVKAVYYNSQRRAVFLKKEWGAVSAPAWGAAVNLIRHKADMQEGPVLEKEEIIWQTQK